MATLLYKNKIYEIMNMSKNDLIRWAQMIVKGILPSGWNWETGAMVYGNYNVWEIGVLEATKSLVKKYKKRGIKIEREIKDGKKTVIVKFPDELLDKILEQLIPKHITFEEIRAKMVRKIRNLIERHHKEKLLKKNYDLALELFEKHKVSNDPLKSRFAYWYFWKIGIDTSLEK